MSEHKHTWRASAAKRGRFLNRPYVPIVEHFYEGPACAVPRKQTSQLRGFAYETRDEAIACARRYIEANGLTEAA